MNPAPPVTSTSTAGLVMSPPEADFCIVSQHEPVRARLDGNPVNTHVFANQAVYDAVGEVAHGRSFEDDAVLDLGTLDFDVVSDGGERPDVGVLDPGAAADDRRSPDHGPLHRRARL